MPASLLFAVGFLLAGCFDLNVGVALHSDGSGTLTNELVFSKEMTDTIKAHGGKPPETKLGKDGTKTATYRDGRLVQTSVVTFKNLSEVKMPGQGMEVRDLGRTWFGAHRNVIVWSALGSHDGAKAPDADNPFAKAMFAQFAGHYFTISMTLPCHVERAATVKVGGKAVAPAIESSWSGESHVAWKIPLEAMLEGTEAEDTHFDVTCWSWNGIVPGKAKDVPRGEGPV